MDDGQWHYIVLDISNRNDAKISSLCSISSPDSQCQARAFDRKDQAEGGQVGVLGSVMVALWQSRSQAYLNVRNQQVQVLATCSCLQYGIAVWLELRLSVISFAARRTRRPSFAKPCATVGHMAAESSDASGLPVFTSPDVTPVASQAQFPMMLVVRPAELPFEMEAGAPAPTARPEDFQRSSEALRSLPPQRSGGESS